MCNLAALKTLSIVYCCEELSVHSTWSSDMIITVCVSSQRGRPFNNVSNFWPLISIIFLMEEAQTCLSAQLLSNFWFTCQLHPLCTHHTTTLDIWVPPSLMVRSPSCSPLLSAVLTPLPLLTYLSSVSPHLLRKCPERFGMTMPTRYVTSSLFAL